MVMLQTSDNHIIDEASMIGKNMGDCIDATAKAYHKKLVMSGDWAQAAPVKDDLILKSRILDDFEFIKLTENHRQADAEYINALNQVRVGKAGKDVEEAFSGCLCAKPPDDDHFLRMYATNQKTEAYNQFRLWRHVDDTASGAFQLCASFKDVRDGDKQKKRPRSESFRMNAIANSPFSHGEPLAVGCRVLITVNDHAREYVNGDTGTLMSATVGDGRQVNEAIAAYKESGRNFSVSSVRVLLDRTGKEVTVFYQLREVKDPTGRYVQHAISGLPVKLGYACTTHKSQGMTVERAWFDMGSLGRFPDDKSRHGLAYVALSRTKSLEGLLISQWVPEMIYCNPEIAELL
jgi:ATP-dependent exoDNAse (exonuclease V) alpha subunit